MKMNNLVCVIKRKFDMLLLSNCKAENLSAKGTYNMQYVIL